MALPTASDNVFPKVILSEGAAPATPAATQVKLYAKADGLLYSKDDAGVETALGAGSGIPATIVDVKGDIIAATAADTVARLAAGTNDQVLTADSAQALGVKWAAAGAGSLSYQQAKLGADVTMTTANTYYDGPSVTLSAGTWLINGQVIVGNGGGVAHDTGAKLWDGTTVAASMQLTAALYYVSLMFSPVVVVIASGTPTWKITAKVDFAGAAMKAAAIYIVEGNNASWIAAVKIAA